MHIGTNNFGDSGYVSKENIMKIAFCSDVHGNIYAFDAFLKSIDSEAIDEVFFLGDVLVIIIMQMKSYLSCAIGALNVY